jgi:hypothetical protein
LSVEVATGRQGAVTEVDTGKSEASLRKSEILPGQAVRGYILTEGVSEVKMNVGARKGSPVSGLVTPEPEPESVDWVLWIYGTILAVAAIIGLVLLRRSYSQLVALKILGPGGQISGSSFSLLIALIGLAFLIDMFTDVSFGNLFYAFLLFIFLTNYELFMSAVEGLASLTRPSSVNQIPPIASAESPESGEVQSGETK